MKTFIICMVILAVLIIISMYVTQAIVESDMPLWLKIWLLKG